MTHDTDQCWRLIRKAIEGEETDREGRRDPSRREEEERIKLVAKRAETLRKEAENQGREAADTEGNVAKAAAMGMAAIKKERNFMVILEGVRMPKINEKDCFNATKL